LGAPPLFVEGAGFPSTTKLPGLRPTSVPSGILIIIIIIRKFITRTCSQALSMNRRRGDIQPFALFSMGVAGSTSNTNSPGPRKTSMPSGILVHPAVWPQRTLAENWGLCTFRGGGAGSASNTPWPGPRPTCKQSFMLIHPTIWPQCSNVTDRQTNIETNKTDRQRPIA